MTPAPLPGQQPPPPAPGQQQQENYSFCKNNPTSPKCAGGGQQPPPPGPSQQEQENYSFCKNNPTSPKCAGGGQQPPPPPPGQQEQDNASFCKNNPNSPKCGGPVITPPPQAPQRIPSVCEQNPQWPQCQQDRPDDAAPPTPAPPGGGGQRPPRRPPRFPQPPDSGPPPVQPAPPPSSPLPPPPPPSGGTQPTGPQIQTVTQCPEGQRLSITGECFEPCPEGTSWYPGPGANHNTCIAECPGDSVGGYLDDGTGQCRQCAQGIIADGQCQCNEGYVASTNPNSYSLCEPCGGVVYQGQCVQACPEGTLNDNRQCVEECSDGTTEGAGNSAGVCIPEQCPEGQLHEFNRCVDECGSGYNYVMDGVCLTQCPEGTVGTDGQCVAITPPITECPEGQFLAFGACQPEVCPEGTYRAADSSCVAQCPEGSEPVSDGAGPYCRQQCPADQFAEFTRCVDECNVAYPVTIAGVCLTQCPEGTALSGDQCVANCPQGQLLDQASDQCVQSCPEGFAAQDGICQPVSETGCVGDEVLLEGQCVPYLECYTGLPGTSVPHEGQCLESCPDGLVQRGSQCVEECPEGWNEEDNICQRYCLPDDSGPLPVYCTTCPEGTTLHQNQCVSGCPDGMQEQGGLCRPINCETGQILINDVCTPAGDIGYEEFVDLCTDEIGAGGPQVQIPPEYAGQTTEEICQNLIDNMCDSADGLQGVPSSEAQACLQQPCAGGQQNVNGQCVTVCPDGQLVNAGQCVQSCPDGTVADGGQCQQCPSGEVEFNGLCVLTGNQTECSGNWVLLEGKCVGPGYCTGIANATVVDGQCIEPPATDTPPPAEGEQPPPDGTQPPPDGTQPPPDGAQPPNQDGSCPEGLVKYYGTCITKEACAGRDGAVYNNEYCTAPPPPNGEQPPDTTQPPPDGTQPPPPGTGTPPPGTGQPPAPPAPGKVKKLPAQLIASYKNRLAARRPLGVVIASARYSSKVIKNSKHAVGGAAAFVTFLKEDMKLPASRILTLRNGRLKDYSALFGRPGAPAGRLQKTLAGAPASELIIYYSGRAMPVDEGKDIVLLPRDAKFGQPLQTGYRLSDIYRNLHALGVKRLRFYLDTALSTPGTAQPVPNAPAPKRVQTRPVIGPLGVLTQRHWIAMSAATGDQPAYTDPKASRSAFTELLLGALRGAADWSPDGNRDGAVSAGELNAYMRRELDIAVQKSTGGTQRPGFYGRAIEILIAGRVAVTAPPAPPPAQPPAPPAPPATPAPAPQQQGAVKPSFDCRKARAPAEKAICANPAIATLDNVMVGLYRQARAARKGAARNALTAQQRQWLKRRNACGSDVACLAQRYGERIGQLQ